MENKIVSFLRESNKTISFAESCTGGALSKRIVLIPGASEFFNGSIVSYSNNTNIKLYLVYNSCQILLHNQLI